MSVHDVLRDLHRRQRRAALDGNPNSRVLQLSSRVLARTLRIRCDVPWLGQRRRH